jgi:hypothetical protein
MREDGLRARHRRRFVNTTQSRHKFPIAKNVVARAFEVSAPNQVWVSDLTYLRTQTGFVYMAVVLGLFARRVVGWVVSRNLDAGIAVEALRRALAVRPAPAGLVHHSDRGVHYACTEYRALLASRGIAPSMSRKGDCWGNAVALHGPSHATGACRQKGAYCPIGDKGSRHACIDIDCIAIDAEEHSDILGAHHFCARFALAIDGARSERPHGIGSFSAELALALALALALGALTVRRPRRSRRLLAARIAVVTHSS